MGFGREGNAMSLGLVRDAKWALERMEGIR